MSKLNLESRIERVEAMLAAPSEGASQALVADIMRKLFPHSYVSPTDDAAPEADEKQAGAHTPMPTELSPAIFRKLFPD